MITNSSKVEIDRYYISVFLFSLIFSSRLNVSAPLSIWILVCLYRDRLGFPQLEYPLMQENWSSDLDVNFITAFCIQARTSLDSSSANLRTYTKIVRTFFRAGQGRRGGRKFCLCLGSFFSIISGGTLYSTSKITITHVRTLGVERFFFIRDNWTKGENSAHADNGASLSIIAHRLRTTKSWRW